MNKKRQIIVKVNKASMKGMYRGGGLLMNKRLVVLSRRPNLHLLHIYRYHGHTMANQARLHVRQINNLPISIVFIKVTKYLHNTILPFTLFFLLK